MVSRDARIAIVAGGGGLVLAVGGLFFWQRSMMAERATPAWTEAHQPPEGIALQPSQSASWCAARPPLPSCAAGTRLLRDYAPDLVAEPESLVRGGYGC